MPAFSVRVTGRVQGVGYRAFAQRMATALKISGHVRNEEDGSVALVISGDDASIRDMIEALRRGPRSASVTQVEGRPWPDPVEPGFRILGVN